MNEKDIELLTSIYQNCKTALQSIADLEPSVESDVLRAELREEQERYKNFATKCQEVAQQNDQELTDNNIFEKAKLWTSVKMSTMADKSTRHLAEMLLLGTVMGTLQCYKDLCDYRNCEKSLLELCGELLKLEESHFDYLKMFLKSDHDRTADTSDQAE